MRVLNGTHYDPPTEKLKDYVIGGLATDWEKDDTRIPVALKLSTGQRQKVIKDVQGYFKKGYYVASRFDLSLKANQIPGPIRNRIPATVVFSDEHRVVLSTLTELFF